jgi:predicted nucleic acid-binding protein
MPRVFIDTSGFFAWASQDDHWHERAVQILTDRSRRFLTTDWILGETVNLLGARRKPHLASRLFDLMETTRVIDIAYVGPDAFWRAKEFWIKHSEHPLSFTDCTSLVVAKERKIAEALTTDRHFQIAGLRTLLT